MPFRTNLTHFVLVIITAWRDLERTLITDTNLKKWTFNNKRRSHSVNVIDANRHSYETVKASSLCASVDQISGTSKWVIELEVGIYE